MVRIRVLIVSLFSSTKHRRKLLLEERQEYGVWFRSPSNQLATVIITDHEQLVEGFNVSEEFEDCYRRSTAQNAINRCHQKIARVRETAKEVRSFEGFVVSFENSYQTSVDSSSLSRTC
ncbi:hypothetical protein GEMRC1_005826 [Eukaryota sp. GEM-RC1]